MNPAIRASDDDRRRVVTALERHAAAGRLRLDEFDERATAALHAVTLGDLAALTRDLPTDPAYVADLPHTGGPARTDPARAGAPARPIGLSAAGSDAGARSLVLAFALATITLLVLGVILAVAR